VNIGHVLDGSNSFKTYVDICLFSIVLVMFETMIEKEKNNNSLLCLVSSISVNDDQGSQ
jgi:hypothetical protein